MEIIFIMLLGAILNGLLASSRGRTAAGWALLGALFPLISLLILVLMPNLKEQTEAHVVIASAQARTADALRARDEAEHRHRLAEMESRTAATRECPYCAETIKTAAIVCRFCGRDVEPITRDPVIKQPSIQPTLLLNDDSSQQYMGISYTQARDFSITAIIDGRAKTWPSLYDFRNWADFKSRKDK